MDKIFINSEYITLGQFLKFSGIIANGGEAKSALLQLKISVNGVAETRRGRKIYPKDVVKVEKMTFLVETEHEN